MNSIWNLFLFVQMAAQIPETPFERLSKEERDREKLDRQKMLVSLPRSLPEQEYLALAASEIVEQREVFEEALLVANTLTAGEKKNTLVQAMRHGLERATMLHNMALVAAKEGLDTANQIFCPAPSYGELSEDQLKKLEKIKKDKEAAKKKEDKSGWKGNNFKKTTPYSYSGKGAYGGGYGGGLSNWALQQALLQLLTSKQTDNGGATGSGGARASPAAAASSSGSQQSSAVDYNVRMAVARMSYPCNCCGVMGHWKKDGQCKPADVAAYIQKRMAEQSQREQADEEESSAMCIFSSKYFTLKLFKTLTICLFINMHFTLYIPATQLEYKV